MVKLTEREMDRYCWLLVSWRNRFYPPDETAEECIETFEDEEDDDVLPTEYTRGHEHGYHDGMYIAFNEMMEQLYIYGINVMARANRYTKVHRDAGTPLRTDDSPDYYLATDNGAEVKTLQSSLYDSIEIESLGEAEYEPRV